MFGLLVGARWDVQLACHVCTFMFEMRTIAYNTTHAKFRKYVYLCSKLCFSYVLFLREREGYFGFARQEGGGAPVIPSKSNCLGE